MNFVRNMEAMTNTLPIMIIAMQQMEKHIRKEFEEFRDKYGKVIEETKEGGQAIHFPLKHAEKATKSIKNIDDITTVNRIFPKTYIISLVSQYDAFLMQLVGYILRAKPEILNSSERKINFSDLFNFTSLQEAQDYIAEKEVESVMRESHAKQFEWIENKLSIKLRQDEQLWAKYIEITERRNLFTHTDGIVSSQYINNCKAHGAILDTETKTGLPIKMPPGYLKDAQDTLFEIGIKLSHIVWRKLAPSEREDADGNLIAIGYNLLKWKQYKLAARIHEFAVNDLKKYSSERNRKIFIINLAQSYKFSAPDDKHKNILEKEDWSLAGPEFRICIAVLNDKFDEAAEIMRKSKNAEDLSQAAYVDWPIFREFRKSDAFKNAYKDVFNQKYDVEKQKYEKPTKPVKKTTKPALIN